MKRSNVIKRIKSIAPKGKFFKARWCVIINREPGGPRLVASNFRIPINCVQLPLFPGVWNQSHLNWLIFWLLLKVRSIDIPYLGLRRLCWELNRGLSRVRLLSYTHETMDIVMKQAILNDRVKHSNSHKLIQTRSIVNWSTWYSVCLIVGGLRLFFAAWVFRWMSLC